MPLSLCANHSWCWSETWEREWDQINDLLLISSRTNLYCNSKNFFWLLWMQIPSPCCGVTLWTLSIFTTWLLNYALVSAWHTFNFESMKVTQSDSCPSCSAFGASAKADANHVIFFSFSLYNIRRAMFAKCHARASQHTHQSPGGWCEQESGGRDPEAQAQPHVSLGTPVQHLCPDQDGGGSLHRALQ